MLPVFFAFDYTYCIYGKEISVSRRKLPGEIRFLQYPVPTRKWRAWERQLWIGYLSACKSSRWQTDRWWTWSQSHKVIKQHDVVQTLKVFLITLISIETAPSIISTVLPLSYSWVIKQTHSDHKRNIMIINHTVKWSRHWRTGRIRAQSSQFNQLTPAAAGRDT